jgi:hypothetical protein
MHMSIIMKVESLFNSGVSCCLLDGKRGMINAQQVAGAINDPEFYNSPLTSLCAWKILLIRWCLLRN